MPLYVLNTATVVCPMCRVPPSVFKVGDGMNVTTIILQRNMANCYVDYDEDDIDEYREGVSDGIDDGADGVDDYGDSGSADDSCWCYVD